MLGIVVKKPESLFTNGCVQQAYFLYKILQNTGFETRLVTFESNYDEFEVSKTKIHKLEITHSLEEYDLIIFASATVNHKLWLEKLKMQNVRIVSLVCGNLYMLHQEQYVFGKHNIIADSLNDYVDEYWVLPMYTFAVTYIEMLTKKPARVVPYVWDPDIIRKYITENALNVLDQRAINNDKVNLLILEPNMSIHKTSLIPILIAENYHVRNPGKVNTVFHLCANNVTNMNKEFWNSLSLVRDGVVNNLPRAIMTQIVHRIRMTDDFPLIVVTHNIKNELNFLHLELFEMNIPVIHNCKPFLHNGLYYNDNNLWQAVEYIDFVRKQHPDTTKNENHHGSDNKNNIERYKVAIESSMEKHIDIRMPRITPLNAKIPKLDEDKAVVVIRVSTINEMDLAFITLQSLEVVHSDIKTEVIVPTDLYFPKLQELVGNNATVNTTCQTTAKIVIHAKPGVMFTQKPELFIGTKQFQHCGLVLWPSAKQYGVNSTEQQNIAWGIAQHYSCIIPINELVADDSLVIVDRAMHKDTLAHIENMNETFKRAFGEAEVYKFAALLSGKQYFIQQKLPGLIGFSKPDIGFRAHGTVVLLSDTVIAYIAFCKQPGECEIIAWPTPESTTIHQTSLGLSIDQTKGIRSNEVPDRLKQDIVTCNTRIPGKGFGASTRSLLQQHRAQSGS